MKLKNMLCSIIALAMVLSTIGVPVFAEGNAAKVGNTEYATIDEAIANWTNGTTLTLLDNVTLSDVIKISSTEHHILDLGTYTMTAAKNKDAIQYVVNGRSSMGVALDIKADDTNPGGIIATGGSVVRHTKPLISAPSKDRPITRFYGGVFDASYVVRQGGTLGAGYTGANAPAFYFYGGEFNGTIYTNRSQNQFYGGTFNGSMQMSVDSSAYTMIAGGTFKDLSNSFGSSLTSDKFTIGSSKGANNGSVCIDENGNYVITTTTPAEAEASVASNYNSNNYFYYSTVNTNGMYYEDVYDALEDNKTGEVTVFTDELNLSETAFKGTIVVPEGEEITIIVAEGTTPAWTIESAVENEKPNVTYKDTDGDELVKNEESGAFEEVPPVAKVGDVKCADATEMLNALKTASGEVTVEIYGKLTTGGFGLDNSNIEKLSFVGMTDDAEICVDGVSYIDVRYTKYPVEYTDLILSHINAGQNIDGFLPQYFSTYNSADVTYTECTFPNGVTAGGNIPGTTYTFNDCTFNNTTSGLYSLWIYGNSTNVVVDGGVFCGVRGIKMYSEGSDDFSSLSVSEATFSDTITEKHAIVLTKGESIALTDNTFNNTKGIVEVDDDHASLIGGKTVTINGTEYIVDSESLALKEVTPTETVVAQTKDINGNVIKEYADFESALAAACADNSVARIEILGDITQTEVISAKYYDITKDLTIGSADGENYTVSIKPVDDSVAVRVMDGGSLTIEENITFDHLDVVANGFSTTGENMNIDGTLKAISLKQWTSNGTITVSKTGKVWLGFGDGQFDLAYGNGTVTINGNGDETEPQFKAGYSGTRGNGNTLNLNDTYFEGGAWFNVDGSNGTFNVDNSILKVSGGDDPGRLTVASTGNTIKLTNGSTLDVANLILGADNELTIDGTSQVKVTKLTGDGTITIDAANLTVGAAPIEGDASEFSGAIDIINNDALEAKIDENGKIVLVEATAPAVAKIGDTEYATLEEAFKAATANCTIEILSDVTIDYYWDCRYTGSKFTVPVTINGNNNTLTFTNTVYDAGNHYSVFRFENDATVKNLTVDMTNAISRFNGRFRAISAKGNLTVDKCKFIGNGSANNTRAIIFGESGTAESLANVSISITDSEFTAWRQAISDNESGKTEVKTVVITGNTMNDAGVNVSASESITFTGNTMNGKYVKLVTYAADNKLNVTATGNTLTENGSDYNYTNAKDANVQEGFVLPWDGVTISNLDELKKFRDAVNAGDTYAGKTVTLTADIDLAGENWTPIGVTTYDKKYEPVDPSVIFSGTFDGNNKKISNLKIEKTIGGGADAEANLGLFGFTGEDAVIKDLTITNVNINTDGRNVGALAGFAYKSELENITINGNIQIIGGNNVSGVCAMTRYHDVSATNITVSGAEGSTIAGNNIVGGIFAEIAPESSKQTFSNLKVENVAITGVSGVGGIVGLLTNGAVSNVTVKDVELVGKTTWKENEGRIRMGSVAGLMGGHGPSTISGVTVENVTGKNLEGEDVVLPVIGANYDGVIGNATEAKIGDKYYATLEDALKAAVEDDTITLLAPIVVAAGEKLELNKDVTITYTSNVPGEDMITNRGNLVIDGTTLVYTNTDTTAENVTVSTISCEAGSELEVKSGTVKNDSANNGAKQIYAFAIDMLTNGNLGDVTATISGGEVISTNYMAIRQFNNGDACKNTLNVVDGYIYGAGRAIQVHLKNDAAYTTISGGKIEAGEGGYALCLFPENATHLTVSGGEFKGIIYSGTDGFISGGTFDAEPYEEYLADGYEVVESNGVWGVQEKQPEETISWNSKVALFNKMANISIVGTNERYGRIRVLAGIDDPTKYASYGFKYTVTKGNETTSGEIKLETVYEKVRVNYQGTDLNYLGKHFGEGNNYIMDTSLCFAPEWVSSSTKITVTPFVEFEGTEYLGTSFTNTSSLF